MTAGTSPVDRLLARRRIIVTCGTGGVGKTTLSAALAMRAAILGRRAVVITIDPAKRLATSLGLDTLGDHPADLTPRLREACERAGTSCPGTLAAIMPDTRQTFETFVRSLSPNEEIAQRVIRNPIFQIFAKEFSGTNEYMALERLYALDQQGHEGKRYDCIILDTPPSRNTLEFLDAPRLLARFFEERLIRWLVLPANKIVSVGMRKALGILEKLTGAGFMTHLLDFAGALFEVRVGFTANLRRITALLESEQVGFLLVAAPSPEVAPEALQFVRSIREHRFHFDGVALNRTLGYLEIGPEARQTGDPGLREAIRLLEALQARERAAVEGILGDLPRAAAGAETPADWLEARLPELARDVHSVEDLFHVAMAFDDRLQRRDGEPR
jgi:anion-transporting  ArsA/GET3 family ATPase